MKKENRSLFLYTSLIFVVSILMILIAFVGQNNIKNVYPQNDKTGTSLTDRVNQLNQTNAMLTNEIASLNREKEIFITEKEAYIKRIEEMTSEIVTLNDLSNKISAENETTNKLLEIYKLISENRITKAKEIYNAIVAENLTEQQKIYYDDITTKLNN